MWISFGHGVARHGFPMQLLVTVPALHALNGVFVMDDEAGGLNGGGGGAIEGF